MVSLRTFHLLADQTHLLLVIEDDIVVLWYVVGVHLGEENLVFFFDFYLAQIHFCQLVVLCELKAHGGAHGGNLGTNLGVH